MIPVRFEVRNAPLFGWLHKSVGRTGVVIVQGGGQTRVGPQRLFVRLAADLAAAGHPVLRFDEAPRRQVFEPFAPACCVLDLLMNYGPRTADWLDEHAELSHLAR